jgi:hypothetical protein
MPVRLINEALPVARNVSGGQAVAIEPSLPRESPENGNIGVVTGDFCRIDLSVREFGSSETGAELQKPANSGLFCSLRGGTSGLGTGWLATQC